MARLVVKVGGSLYDDATLGPRLRTWLADRGEHDILIVPGGGPAADAVRFLDRVHNLPTDASHWLALRALTLAAAFLAERLALPVVTGWDTFAGLAVLDPFAFAVADDTTDGALPHTWDVTSDALAARVAVVGGAERVILLKSAVPPDEDPRLWHAHGYVDAWFARVLASAPGLLAEAVCFRNPEN